MRPSLTTLAGMTLAAGSIALAGASLVGGAAHAQAETFYTPPVMSTIDNTPHQNTPLDLGPLVSISEPATLQPTTLQPREVGTDAEIGFANTPDDDYSWLDDDGCPPCGMG